MQTNQKAAGIDKVALVTGATRGIGLSVARSLLDTGMRVIFSGRDRSRLESIVSEMGSAAHALVLDVADPAGCAGFIDDLPVELRAIDVLVNNAGHDVGGRRLFHEGDSHNWDAIIETNVKGLMRVTHAVLPGMLERGSGHIINLGSVAGVYTYRTGNAYNASKFAVHGFTEALRKDLDHTDLRVTEIMPGLVKTDFAENRNQGDAQAAEEFYRSFPVHLEPKDVARAVVYAVTQPGHVVISQLMIEPVRRRS